MERFSKSAIHAGARPLCTATMKFPVIITCLFIFSKFRSGQTTKEQRFTVTVQRIIIAFSKQDSTMIAPFINKEIGLYQLDRMGLFGHYNHLKTLSFCDTAYPQFLFRRAKIVKLLSLQCASLPIWNCDKEVWSKKGLFVDITKADHLLSTTCKERNKYVPGDIPDKTIQFFFNLENKSRRVVLYDNKGIEAVFI